MRSEGRFRLTPGGALLLGALAFLLRPGELAALACAVFAHEFGHLCALWLMGQCITGLTIAATGPVIRCHGFLTRRREIAAALSGPLFGAILSLALYTRWPLASEMSAVLTAVNLLPLLPLDGGRALHAVFSDCAHAEMLMKRIRFCFLALLLLCGGYGTAAGWGPALLLFALWLAIVPEAPTALAKQRRLL